MVAVISDHGEGLKDHGEDEHSVLLYREALRFYEQQPGFYGPGSSPPRARAGGAPLYRRRALSSQPLGTPPPSGATGSEISTVVPALSWLRTRISPPWSSTIWRAMARPRPVPLALVV